IKHTLAQKYDGEKSPKLVLLSPIAVENLKSPNLPDGEKLNPQIQKYTDAMAEVAAKNNVPFVDLFSASKKLYAESKEPLTINGIHLNPLGNRLIGEEIDEALFGARAGTNADLETLRKAVADKN